VIFALFGDLCVVWLSLRCLVIFALFGDLCVVW
jgi:hypothetical protein